MKQWQAPKLIVLVRGRPEEAILASCKGGTILTDMRSDFDNCTWISTPPFFVLCSDCSTVMDS